MKYRKILLLCFFLPGLVSAQFTLSLIETQIESEYPIAHLSADSLKSLFAGPDSEKIVLFDVREEAEYQTSHLRGAYRVDPELADSLFFLRFADLITGKQLIFYCSVGKRSSIFAVRVDSLARKLNASVANLRGGIFRWYNLGYTVVNQAGPTDQIHPYNAFWGALVEKRTR